MTSRTELAREWQTRLGRKVSDDPSLAPMSDPGVRLAHARVLLEETFEVLAALGCQVHTRVGPDGRCAEISVDVDDAADLDLVSLAHELTDLNYINETIGAACGLPMDALFDEIHRANLTKIKPDGSLWRHPVKTHCPHYTPPNIRGVLFRKI